jgi:hypothetical protein
MTRSLSTGGRDLPADPPTGTGDAESLVRLLNQCEILEVFDEAIRLRFGQMISAAALKSAKRR